MALAGGAAPNLNYEFAFNSMRFSDCTLVVEIVAVDGSSRSGSGGSSVLERPQPDDSTVVTDLISSAEPSPGSNGYSTPKSVHSRKRPRISNGAAKEAGEEEAGDAEEAAEEEKEPDEKGTPVLGVERIIVSSVILAAQSPFFKKLFDSGTFKEAGSQNEVKLRVYAGEVDALKELVYFMYCSRFNTDYDTNDPVNVLAVLGLADQLRVEAASRHCVALLQAIPITPEIALMYLDYPVSNGLVHLLKPIRLSAVSFFGQRFKDIEKCNDELMTMPLTAIRAVFTNNQIVVMCEDSVFQFLLKWVTASYTDPIQRKSVFNNNLIPLVRFVHLSCWQLRDLLYCDLLDLTKYSPAIVYALLFKADPTFSQILAMRVRQWNYAPRCYVMKALKITHFQQPFYQCICYMDLTREDCLSMFPASRVCSEAFSIARHQMMVKAGCSQQEGGEQHFGVYIGIHNFSQPVTCRVEIGVRRRPGYFETDFRCVATFTSGDVVMGAQRLFPWAQLVAEDGPFFINGKLHLRVDVTLIPQQQQQQPQPQPQQQPQQLLQLQQ